MKKQVLIASDSTCDLNRELLEQNEIELVPLIVNLGEAQYFDGVDIAPEQIYAHYEKTGQLPKTSAPSMADFQAFFKEHTEQGRSIVFFTISAEMSTTYNNARLAAEDYEDVYVVDTRNLSTGGGLLVLAAAEMAKKGMTAEEIAGECTAMVGRVDASFGVDDLEFLHKGGRCSAVAAFGANLLQLKPCIVVKNGKMGVSKKYRGRFAVVLKKYIEERIGDASDIDLSRVFVTHAGCEKAIIEQCVEQVRASAPFAEVLVTQAGCTISSHCGRNTLGVLFIRTKNIASGENA